MQNEFNTSSSTLLKQYKSRIVKENWIKSIMTGLIAGFSATTVCALICWIFGIKYLWIYILMFTAATALTTILSYFCKFKSSNRQLASRIDELGLEERILTMVQLENDDSYIAQKQREDAVSALSKLNSSLLKITVSISMIILCCVTFVVGASAATASTLTDTSLLDIIKQKQIEKETIQNTIHLRYGVKDDVGGRVDGELEQSLLRGNNGAMIQAVATDGYVFIGWTDGYEYSTRIDANVQKDITVNAIFISIEDDEEVDETLEEKQEGNSGSSNATNQPGNQGNPADGGGDGQGEGAGTGADSSSNQVIDGSTYYGDEYGGSLSDAQDSMNSNTNLSGNEKGIIGDYFHNIQK